MLKKLNENEISVLCGGHSFILGSLKTLYWPLKKMLIIADLHLEKGSYFAARGNPIPLYDSLDTLKRLKKVCEIYNPEIILSLGDNIHDSLAFKRMNKMSYELLAEISLPLKQWLWVLGNHDSVVVPKDLGQKFIFCKDFQLDNILFSHDFVEKNIFQIVGHYHPKITIKRMTGKCYVHEANKLVLPAFGTYAGGLDVNSSGFKKLDFNENYNIFMIYKEKIWQVR